MPVAGAIHIIPVDVVLHLWSRGWSAVRIVARVADENGDRFTENSVHRVVRAARERGDLRAIHHRPGAKKKDWRG